VSERTLVLVKPDGVRRGLVGEVIGRIERKGLSVIALQMRTLDRETAGKHYAEHTERPFFGELVEFITGGPLVAMVVEGPRAVEAVRTVRGDFALEIGQNIVHGSDSPESGVREAGIFFPDL
jgi:nucleoside-diphosphate kinase